MGKVGGGGGGGGGGATAAAGKKKKKGRPSLLDLQKRALEQQKLQNQQQLQRRSSRRNPNSTSGDVIVGEEEEEYYDDDDDDERKEKKVKLVVRLPQSDQQQHLSSDLIRSSSVNSASCGSDSNADVDNRKVKSGSGGVATDHPGEKVLKAMDTLHGLNQKPFYLCGFLANRYESKLIESISKDILDMRHKIRSMDDGEKLVGVDDQIEEIDLSPFSGSGKVHMLGICGIGGIGKTTLARAIYNKMCKDFKGCCFFENVQGVTKVKSIVEVQMQIINSVLKTRVETITNVSDGINLIKTVSKPILLVSG